MCVWSVIGYFREPHFKTVNWGQLVQKAVSSVGKMLIFESVVKMKVRVRFWQTVVIIGVRVLEMNTSLCNVPKSDLGQRVCVCVVHPPAGSVLSREPVITLTSCLLG